MYFPLSAISAEWPLSSMFAIFEPLVFLFKLDVPIADFCPALSRGLFRDADAF